jgi:hypothetical protein
MIRAAGIAMMTTTKGTTATAPSKRSTRALSSYPAKTRKFSLTPYIHLTRSANRFVRVLVGTASLAGFLFGYDTGIISGAL